MQKILITTLITFLLSGALVFNYANAALDFGQGNDGLLKGVAEGSGYVEKNAPPPSLSATVGRIIQVALSLVGMIFFALAVYAGILWMTASGNEEQVTKATSILKAATIGLIIALAAYSITAFITLRAISVTKTPPAQRQQSTVGATSECWNGVTGVVGSAIDYGAAGASYGLEAANCVFGLLCDWEFEDPCP